MQQNHIHTNVGRQRFDNLFSIQAASPPKPDGMQIGWSLEETHGNHGEYRELRRVTMSASAALALVTDVQAFINEYFEAWQGTDEERILSYYAECVCLQIPGSLMNGKAAVRDQFVRPFIRGFPGNRHVAKNMIFGPEVVVVEWSFEAEHKGPFAGLPATGTHVELPGCSVYEFDSVNRKITAGRIYFDVPTLLKQIGGS
jgi:steroid delta-isomerase-like uncharacterized protein